MKYIRRGLIYLLISTVVLYSQDFELQLSTGSSDVFNTHSFLADPISDAVFSSGNYESFSPFHYYVASSDLLWFEVDKIDLLQPLSQRESLQALNLQQDRFNLYRDYDIGISLQIDFPEWQNSLHDMETWDRWLHSLSLYLKDQNIKYLEIYPVTEDLLNTPVKDKIMELQSILEKQNVVTILGIQEASAALVDSPFLWEIRAFDYSGKHSTLEALEEQLFLLEKKGIPSDKILAGIPLYGRIYSSEQTGYWFNSMNYKDICRNFSPSTEENQKGGYFYNGPDLLHEKIDLCRQYDIGGIKLNRIEWDSPEESLSLFQTALGLIQ